MTTTSTDRIEREIVLKTPVSRVWNSLANAEEFGDWFGVALKGKTFAAGHTTTGNITYPGYDHLVCELAVESIEPERRLAMRWHPHAIDPDTDYSSEPKTLIEFMLTKADDGTRLRLVESGFDAIPESRRDEAFRGNSGGWDQQMVNIEKYLANA